MCTKIDSWLKDSECQSQKQNVSMVLFFLQNSFVKHYTLQLWTTAFGYAGLGVTILGFMV